MQVSREQAPLQPLAQATKSSHTGLNGRIGQLQCWYTWQNALAQVVIAGTVAAKFGFVITRLISEYPRKLEPDNADIYDVYSSKSTKRAS